MVGGVLIQLAAELVGEGFCHMFSHDAHIIDR